MQAPNMPAFRFRLLNLFKTFRSHLRGESTPIAHGSTASSESAFLHAPPPPPRLQQTPAGFSFKRQRGRPKKLDPGIEKTENPLSVMEGKSTRANDCESPDGGCAEVGGTERRTAKSADQKFARSWLPKEAAPTKLADVLSELDNLKWRIPLPSTLGSQVERVLGGGLVPGSLVLVGGDPGFGKSTLLLQIAALIAEGEGGDVPAPVLYVSGEESIEQIGSRAHRLRIKAEELLLHSSADIEDILDKAHKISPKALVVDSIQTVYSRGVTGSIGGCQQVKVCASALLRFAKTTNIPVIMIGHVTKTGKVAGPRMLEHMVDAVIYIEGQKSSSNRLLRSVKNRFGSTDEQGVFKMSEAGLHGVSNPREIFLDEQNLGSNFHTGSAVAVIMDGSRAFCIRIQASCRAGSKNVNGTKASRVDMITSIIRKQAGLQLDNDLLLNVVGDVCLRERGGDLAIAAAICSSHLELPIPSGIAFIGEIGLGGELHVVHQMEKRIKTLANLGYKKCIIPKSRDESFLELQQCGGMQTLECEHLKEMMNNVFGGSWQQCREGSISSLFTSSYSPESHVCIFGYVMFRSQNG